MNGLIYFSVNTEVERPNFFSLVEIWQDATTYAAFQAASGTQQVLQHLQPLLIAPLDERDGNCAIAGQVATCETSIDCAKAALIPGRK